MSDYSELRKLQDIIDNQADRILDLEAALRIFADPLSWRRDGSCDPNSGRFEGQSIARAALAPEPQK